MPEKACALCGAPVISVQPLARFCTERCRKRAEGRRLAGRGETKPRECDGCGVSFAPKQIRQRYCTQRCSWRDRERRKNGRTDWGDRSCSHCGCTFTEERHTGKPTLYCSLACREAVKYLRSPRAIAAAKKKAEPKRPADKNKGNHRRRAKRYGVPYEVIHKDAVFVRDGWMCGICADPIDPALKWPDQWSASLDHVVPMSCGGGHTYDNVQAAHWWCNTVKGADETFDLRAS